MTGVEEAAAFLLLVEGAEVVVAEGGLVAAEGSELFAAFGEEVVAVTRNIATALRGAAEDAAVAGENVISEFVGQGWQAEGLSTRLAELAGYAEGAEARNAAAMVRFISNLGSRNFPAALESATEVFSSLEGESQAEFLNTLRALGQESGIEGVEALFGDFSRFLERRMAQDFLIHEPTTVAQYLEAGGAELIDGVMGEGVGANILNGLSTAYNWITNPVGSLIDGIASFF